MEGTSPSAEKSRLVHRFLLAEKTAKDLIWKPPAY